MSTSNLALHWDHYWRSGQTHSCFNADHPADTLASWIPVFASFPPGAHILDLACGAGALARMAVSADKSFEVVGVDYASNIAPIPGVRLITGTQIEALPFADDSFDAVISQFGFEYADSRRATAEAARVLKPGGFIALLIHAREGQPLRDLSSRITRVTQLTAPEGLVTLIRRLGDAFASSTVTSALEQKVRSAHSAALAAGQDETTWWALGFAGELITQWKQFEPAYLVNNAAALEAELSSYCARLQAMVAAALSEDGAHALREQFASLNMAMADVTPANSPNGDLVAWLVQGVKCKG